MPTHTPSPRRFLAPQAPPKHARAVPRPPSQLRHGQTADSSRTIFAGLRDDLKSIESPQVASSRRFLINPTKSEKLEQRDGGAGAGSGIHIHATPRAKPKRPFERVESIDEGSQESPPSTIQNGTDELTEHSHMFSEETADEDDGDGAEDDDDDDDDAEILFNLEENHKRRRISPEPPSSPPHVALRNIHPPATPAPISNASSHRFLIPPPRTPTAFPSLLNHPPTPNLTTGPDVTSIQTPSRPHFILPTLPTSPPKPATPLPETFSPSRKGQKYIPGGLASTLQSWILEAANTGYAAQARGSSVIWGREKDDSVKMRFKLTSIQGRSGSGSSRESGGGAEGVDCYPGGIVLAHGETSPGLYNASRVPGSQGDGVVNLLLAGQGGARGSGGVRIREGGIVGIRAPTWDVDIEGEKWVVGVDWVLL